MKSDRSQSRAKRSPMAQAGMISISATVALVFAVLTGLGLTWLGRQGLMIFQAPDKFGYDWRHALLSHQEPSTRRDVALVLVGDDSISGYPYQMPVNRKLIATLLQAIDQAGAKSVGLDFIFDRPTEHDDLLLAAIAKARAEVVLGAVDGRSDLRPKYLEFQASFFQRAPRAAIGHLYFDRAKRGIGTQDQTVRFTAEPSDNPAHIKTSFAEALLAKSGRPAKPLGKGGHIAWLQPNASDGSAAISEILVPEHTSADAAPDVVLPASWRAVLKDKMVIVGSAFSDRDRHLIPASIADGRRVPGALIHAHIAAQLADGRTLDPLSPNVELTLVIALAFLAFLAGRHYRAKRYEVLYYIVGGLLLALIGLWLFWARGIILPSDTIFYAGLGGITAGHYSDWLFKRLPFFRSIVPAESDPVGSGPSETPIRATAP